MNVQTRNDVRIYNLSSGPSLPEWIGERARRNLAKKDEGIRRRIELLQDFSMPSASTKLVQSADGRYIMAAGTYPPRIRCYDVDDLSLKFERYLDAGVVDMVMLGDDYSKMALLLEDRSIAFHAAYGAHESVRIPTFGRAMAYEPTTCELLLAAKGNQIYRLNLEDGRFTEPWTFEPTEASANCITAHPCYPLATAGCDDGIVRFYDSRTPDTLKPFLRLDVQAATAGYGFYAEASGNSHEIASLAHDASGLYMAAGTTGGLVALYDVRSSRPLHVMEHKHGLPIHTLRFHTFSSMVLSADEKLIKAWRYKSSEASTPTLGPSTEASLGSVMVNIESQGRLANFIVAGDSKDSSGNSSGVVLTAVDQPKMQAYFIPELGVAPKWCSYLENITEELEERDLNREGTLVKDGQETIYENYKFVSREDVEKLGIANLIGTHLLRGYMHGFFMDVNLYNRVKAVANPFEYEDYQKKKIKERLEAKRASRIAPRASDRKKAAVNPDLADRLQDKARDSTKAGKVASKLLEDDRFGGLFTNPDYAIDEEDDNFKLRNPSGVAAANRKRDNLDSDSDEDDEKEVDVEGNAVPTFQATDDEPSDEANSSDSDDDDDGFGKVRGEAYEQVKSLSRKKFAEKRQKSRSKKVSLLEAQALDGKTAVELARGDGTATKRSQGRLEEMHLPIAQRVKQQDEGGATAVSVRVQGGSKEATFIPKDVRKRMEDEAKELEESRQQKGKRKRRGVKELGLRKQVPFRPRK